MASIRICRNKRRVALVKDGEVIATVELSEVQGKQQAQLRVLANADIEINREVFINGEWIGKEKKDGED